MNPCQCSKQDLNQFHVFHPSSETKRNCKKKLTGRTYTKFQSLNCRPWKGGCIAVKTMAQAGVVFNLAHVKTVGYYKVTANDSLKSKPYQTIIYVHTLSIMLSGIAILELNGPKTWNIAIYVINLRISPPAKNYVFWRRPCSKIGSFFFLAVVALFHQFSRFPRFGPIFAFSHLSSFFILFPKSVCSFHAWRVLAFCED